MVATLKQQLETGLLARTPSEQVFVKQVVALVDSGDLPISLVQSTFLGPVVRDDIQCPTSSGLCDCGPARSGSICKRLGRWRESMHSGCVHLFKSGIRFSKPFVVSGETQFHSGKVAVKLPVAG